MKAPASGEQLMLRLGIGVEVIAINGGGATAVREALAQKRGGLSHKNVVVWACSARDLFDRVHRLGARSHSGAELTGSPREACTREVSRAGAEPSKIVCRGSDGTG